MKQQAKADNRHKLVFTRFCFVTALFVMASCSTAPSLSNKGKGILNAGNNIDGSLLYLRGEFSWWDAEDDFNLSESASKVFSTKVDLVADGQPYKFKIADFHWSTGTNCGADSDINFELNTVYSLNCDTQSSLNPFIFKPIRSGTFKFTLDLNYVNPRLTISRL